MSRDVAPIFADIDAMDAGQVRRAPDPRREVPLRQRRPGHRAAAVIEGGSAGFWATIDGLTHHIQKIYEVGDTVIAQIDVEYRRKDGKSVTVPELRHPGLRRRPGARLADLHRPGSGLRLIRGAR